MRARALALLAAVACNNDAPAQPPFSSGMAGPTGPADTTTAGESSSTSSSSSSSTSSTSSTSSSGSSSSEGSVPDLGTLPDDFGPGQPEGCKGKIDFVFAISRGFTMLQEEAALLASFDGFMTTIQEDFADFDAHIIVPNMEGHWAGTGCESYKCPDYYPNCGPDAEEYMCGSQGMTTICDFEQGAGILFNAGAHATNYPCKLAGDRRYIVVKEEPDLAAQFECIASVGTYGPDTPMMKGIDTALAPEINADGGCNAGFLRPDALLVIVMVMDTADVKSIGSPAKWADKVIAAKGGDPDAVVMVAIIGPLPEDPPKLDCAYDDGIPYINPLRIYAELFPHRVFGDVCGDTFAPAFAQAATVVKDTCGAFIPQ